MAFMLTVPILVALASGSWLSRTSLASYPNNCRDSGGVDESVITTEQLAARENQHSIPCEDNDRERHAFYGAITANLGDGEGIIINNLAVLFNFRCLFC